MELFRKKSLTVFLGSLISSSVAVMAIEGILSVGRRELSFNELFTSLSLLFIILFPVTLFVNVRKSTGSRKYQMFNNINTGILVIDASGKIIFCNVHFEAIFRKISTWLPIKSLDDLSSYNYFDFYLNPDEQRRIFAAESNFPVSSILDIGSEIISSYATPLRIGDSDYSEIIVTWEIITRERNQKRWEKVVEEQIKNTSGELTSASEELMASSFKVKEIAEGTSGQAQDVASFSREVTALILKLGDAVNLSSSKFQVIAESVTSSRGISETALAESRSSRMLIRELSSMASSIARTTQTIQEIMAQTHVLALNANIEAVKAGSAGLGFGVIAKEVGNLAKQTAAMSEEITDVVDTILDKIPLSVSSIETVEDVVREMNSITLSIHDLMVDQAAVMDNMMEHMLDAKANSESITDRMDEVVSHSHNTLEQIGKSRSAAQDIESIAELFDLIVRRFGDERIVTPDDIYHMLTIVEQLMDAWLELFVIRAYGKIAIHEFSLDSFEGKKPANVLRISIENYKMFAALNGLVPEDMPFPRGSVTPTQTYNFLSRLQSLVESTLSGGSGSGISGHGHTVAVEELSKLKNARPVTGKNPNDAYAVAERINRKLKAAETVRGIKKVKA